VGVGSMVRARSQGARTDLIETRSAQPTNGPRVSFQDSRRVQVSDAHCLATPNQRGFGKRNFAKERSALLSSRDGLIHPSRNGSSVEVRTPKGRSKSGGGHVANCNLGNGILRPETFGTISQELPLRIAGPPTETDPWRGKPRKCRAILRRRKSRRFARTTWWTGGDSNL
jgi:hypothetical protein